MVRQHQLDDGVPLDCTTCRHRRAIEHDSPALLVGITRHYCREFIRMDGRTGATESLQCSYAYDTFCGGSRYRPEFWTRVLRAFRII